MAAEPGLRLSGCSYAWLHLDSLDVALAALAEHGLSTIELTTAPPHVHSPGMSQSERTKLARRLDSFGVRAISTNPSFCDINLVSTNPDFRQVSEAQIGHELELAADLGAQTVVVIPGRLHTLAPLPANAARGALSDALERLLTRADSLGVTIGLENNPYGYLGASRDIVSLVDEIDNPRLGIVYDVANALAIEDPAVGVATVAHRLVLTHLSDTWKSKWAHTSPGRGEIDFAAFAAALREQGYTGDNVYELIDMERPEPRLGADIATLAEAGFSKRGGA